ncbi:hypothetical protein M501DRAFT_928682 [Patellaria atrata CBS 101060]|uniref:SNF2 family helicase/ATPase n=1 Tax=Patellaria atrata CBS 101060 TaxID=1346257 RepID=A0A9P4SFV2_9PEZI|nr:hypothetical protein M501DRAFT_928682 [Patellaria atrata CBS 101060]
MTSDDPYSWSIEEVIDAICRSRGLAESRPHAFLGNPEKLEEIFRKQKIDGATLLEDVDGSFLKDECGIQALGERGAILKAIRSLRGQSGQYQYHNPDHPQFHGASAHVRGVTPLIPHSPAHRISESPGLPLRSFTPFQQNYPEAGSSVHALNYSATKVQEPEVTVKSRLAEVTNNRFPSNGIKSRTDEFVIEDSNGRKRRKLDLTQIKTHTPSVDLTSQETPNVSPNSISTPYPALGADQRRDISGNSNAYLGSHKFPVDEVFFGSVPIGGSFSDNSDMDFSISYSRNSLKHALIPGLQEYVNSQMRHFLSGPEQKKIVRGSHSAIAIFPYREDICMDDHPRSVMVLQTDEGKVVISRQDTVTMTIESPVNGAEQSHEWDHLLHWADKDKDDTVLPLWGESDTEEKLSSSFWDEVEEEERGKANSRSKLLDKDSVAQIISEAVNKFITLWKASKLPVRQNQAWAIWKKARRQKDRLMLITFARQELRRLDNRLAKLTNSILNETWNRIADVEKQCLILEETVFQREEILWKKELWESKHPPPKPLKKVFRKKTVPRDGDDGDDVDLDSEIASEPETALESDRFIHIDEIDMTQLFGTNSDGAETVPEGMNQEQHQDVEDRMDIDIEEPNESYAPHIEEPVEDQSNPTASETIRQTTEEKGVVLSCGHVIDLTADTDSSDSKTESDEHDSVAVNSKHLLAYQWSFYWSKTPERCADKEVEAWSYEELQERDDRKRLVMKILRTLDEPVYILMTRRIRQIHKNDFLDEISRAFDALKNGGERITGLDDNDTTIMLRFAVLYLCWYQCSYSIWNGDPRGAQEEVKVALEQVTVDAKLFRPFYEFVRRVLFSHSKPIQRKLLLSQDSKQKNSAVSEEQETLLESSDDPIIMDTPHKRRKREVKQSVDAKQRRQEAIQRQEDQVLKESQLKVMLGSDLVTDKEGIIINPSKNAEHGLIYINRRISTSIKKHQIEGVRFLWREIVTPGQSSMQGCLLAHTMGLGKTMQAIALLMTIAEAAGSPDPAIFEQIPPSLRESRSLVLCPAPLTVNWEEEFKKWAPPSISSSLLGRVRRIDAEIPPISRLNTISAWFTGGGVLIISYSMLRQLVSERSRAALGAESADLVKNQLLNGPNLIIADEAHTLKNPQTSIASLAKQFRSTSRIALTGSPLSNHLIEYFAMIDFVSPGYLGSIMEFKAHYQEPIQEGFFVDSTPAEYRKALKMQKVLEKEIGPKVHRADITVLKGDLPPKVEFVITVPLTALQHDSYKLYVELVESGVNDDLSNAKMWQWLNILALICNHPKSFKDKATPKKQIEISDDQLPDITDEVPDENDDDVVGVQLTSSGLKAQEALYATVQNLGDAHHSNKIQMCLAIISFARKAGDKTLLFSHSLYTLNYVQKELANRKIPLVRLDGKTKMTARQTMATVFNKDGESDVFLISTTAGGQGYNLPGANRVIILDFKFNPAWEEQAIGRAYRIGQRKPVFVYRLIAGGTFEEKMYNKTIFKTQLASRVVDKRRPYRYAQKSRPGEFLFPPKHVEQKRITTQDGRGKDPFVLDKILARLPENQDTMIRSLSTMEVLQNDDNEKLTNEELREIEEIYQGEQLRKTDPIAYRAFQDQIRAARQTAAQQAESSSTIVPNVLREMDNVSVGRQGPVGKLQNLLAEFKQGIVGGRALPFTHRQSLTGASTTEQGSQVRRLSTDANLPNTTVSGGESTTTNFAFDPGNSQFRSDVG